MNNDDRFMMKKQKAQAFGRERGKQFLVEEGSTAMRDGSPNEKRNLKKRNSLIAARVLVQDKDPDLLRFTCDYLFDSASQAGGVIIDGNCSGPKLWIRLSDNKTLREIRKSRKS